MARFFVNYLPLSKADFRNVALEKSKSTGVILVGMLAMISVADQSLEVRYPPDTLSYRDRLFRIFSSQKHIP